MTFGIIAGTRVRPAVPQRVRLHCSDLLLAATTCGFPVSPAG